jgi:Bacterial regulatory helix-turn-helix protein, lysR family
MNLGMVSSWTLLLQGIRQPPFDNSACANYIVHKSLTISQVRMDRFENARVFVTVVEAGGFTRAAERLGLSRAFSTAPRAASA